MTPTAIAERLMKVAAEMEDIAVAMDYYGGFAKWAAHAKEILGSAGIAREWSAAIMEGNPLPEITEAPTAPMSDPQKAFFLSVALGAFETVRNEEKKGSCRYRRLDNSIDNCLKAVELYRPEAWSFEEMEKAGRLLDEINVRIRGMFP